MPWKAGDPVLADGGAQRLLGTWHGGGVQRGCVLRVVGRALQRGLALPRLRVVPELRRPAVLPGEPLHRVRGNGLGPVHG